MAGAVHGGLAVLQQRHDSLVEADGAVAGGVGHGGLVLVGDTVALVGVLDADFVQGVVNIHYVLRLGHANLLALALNALKHVVLLVVGLGGSGGVRNLAAELTAAVIGLGGVVIVVVHRVAVAALAPLNMELDIAGDGNAGGGLLRRPRLAGIAGIRGRGGDLTSGQVAGAVLSGVAHKGCGPRRQHLRNVFTELSPHCISERARSGRAVVEPCRSCEAA